VRTFAARYPGACAAECGERVTPGDEVTYVDDELMHAECADGGASAQADDPRPCPLCWLVHRGECP
jgi:hypothetical protein